MSSVFSSCLETTTAYAMPSLLSDNCASERKICRRLDCITRNSEQRGVRNRANVLQRGRLTSRVTVSPRMIIHTSSVGCFRFGGSAPMISWLVYRYLVARSSTLQKNEAKVSSFGLIENPSLVSILTLTRLWFVLLVSGKSRLSTALMYLSWFL
jgi:hypothetical protein